MAKRDYYEVLGVSRSASEDDLKSASVSSRRQYQPDVSDDRMRKKSLKRSTKLTPSFPTVKKELLMIVMVMPGSTPRVCLTYQYRPIRHSGRDFFGFGGFGGMGNNRRSRNSPRRGADLASRVTLTFEEAAIGVEKDVENHPDQTCETCQGSGAKPGTSPRTCPQCNGQGEVRQVHQTLLGSMVQVVTARAATVAAR